jgi:hypothetical protein
VPKGSERKPLIIDGLVPREMLDPVSPSPRERDGGPVGRGDA